MNKKMFRQKWLIITLCISYLNYQDHCEDNFIYVVFDRILLLICHFFQIMDKLNLLCFKTISIICCRYFRINVQSCLSYKSKILPQIRWIFRRRGCDNILKMYPGNYSLLYIFICGNIHVGIKHATI